MSFAWPTMLHIKKLMGMHNKETYMHVCVRIDMFIHKKCTYNTHMHTCSWEISELHCNQLRLAKLQEGFVWCLFEVISSFCLFREANSGLQMTNYFSQRYRFTSTWSGVTWDSFQVTLTGSQSSKSLERF